MRAEVEACDAERLIQKIPGLREIDDEAWLQAVQAGSLARLAAGCSLTLCSTDVDHFTIVLCGQMKVRARSDDGRIISMYPVRAGDMCMLSIAFMAARERMYADVATESEVILLRIPSPHFENLLAQSQGFRSFMTRCLSGYVLRMLDLVEEVTFQRLQTRIEKHLADVARASGLMTVKITHQELAHELGSTREVISRILKTMEKEGAISLGRGSITLHRLPRLSARTA